MILRDQFETDSPIRPLRPGEIGIDGLPSTVSTYNPVFRPLPVRPIVLSNPVSAADPNGVLQLTAGTATAVVTDSLPPVPAGVVTSNDASVPGFAAVTLAGFSGLPTSLQLLIVLVGLWLIYRWTK